MKKDETTTAPSTSGELEIKVDQQVGLLNWNFDELNSELDVILKKYQGLQFSDDEMDQAKKTRAALNNASKAINDRKIAVKKQFCQPYTLFEEQAKKLIGRINTCSDDINAQIYAYEQEEGQKKQAEITEWWKLNGDANFDISRVWDDHYLNHGFTAAKWQADLNQKKEKIKADLAMLSAAGTGDNEKANFILAQYLKIMDAPKCLAEWEDELQRRQRAAEYKAAQEQRQAEYRAQHEQDRNNAPAPTAPVHAEKLTRTMKVEGTREQIIALGDFMKANGIRFWKVED
jgi:hypothetical protein